MVSLPPKQPLRTLVLAAGVGLVTLFAGVILGAPVLHEYFDPSSAGEGAPEASGAGVDFPARIETESGTVPAPRLNRANPSGSYAQSAERSQEYSLDRDTSRPDLVGYSDPFTPSIPPFKRAFAYDTIDQDFRLTVADKSLRALNIGGHPKRGDDQFFADLNVTLRPGTSVRIPSVGPHARVLAARLVPDTSFELKQDSAENWFIRSDSSGEFRLIMHLAIDRRVFGSDYANVAWAQLNQALPPLPPGLKQQTQVVVQQLELSQQMSPAEVLRKLVHHFRSFAPSDERPASSGVELYQDIALSQKGVCRHRSFAFVVTALSLGIPTRFVRNEAHAWVESFDGELWHRIDLGGAAGRMELSESDTPPHTTPEDPFEWPEGSESGTEMAERALSSGSQPGAGSSTAGAPTSAPTPGTEPDAPEPPSPRTAPAEPPSTPEEAEQLGQLVETPNAAKISVDSTERQTTRGSRVRVSGKVVTSGAACALTRVDIKLQSEAGQWHLLGTLVTDSAGRYSGEVVVPNSVPVGDYDLFAVTPGSQACGAGSSLDPK